MTHTSAITAAIQFTAGNMELVCKMLGDLSCPLRDIEKCFKREGYDSQTIKDIIQTAKEIRIDIKKQN